MIGSQYFGDLLAYPLRSGVSIPASNRGSGMKMLNMGELFRYPRVPAIEMARVEIADYDSDRTLLQRHDLLFARRSLSLEGAGKCAIVDEVDEPTTWEGSILRARLDPAVAHAPYYFYYFASPQGRRNVETIVEQVAAAGIRGSDLKKLEVPHPELPEQHAVADVLSALDDKIAANAKLADISEHLAVTLLSQLKSTVALSSVVRHHKKSTNPELIDAPEVAHYSLPAFDAARGPELTAPTDIKSSKFAIDQPSVLISKLNPRFPRVWDVAEVPSIPALASTEFLVLEPLFSSTAFLWATLSQQGFGMALESKVAGTSGSHQRVKPTDLLDTPVVDPRSVPASLHEQVTSLGGRRNQARTESIFLMTMRDALLPKLISGQLRVREAEKVLERAGF